MCMGRDKLLFYIGVALDRERAPNRRPFSAGITVPYLTIPSPALSQWRGNLGCPTAGSWPADGTWFGPIVASRSERHARIVLSGKEVPLGKKNLLIVSLPFYPKAKRLRGRYNNREVVKE